MTRIGLLIDDTPETQPVEEIQPAASEEKETEEEKPKKSAKKGDK